MWDSLLVSVLALLVDKVFYCQFYEYGMRQLKFLYHFLMGKKAQYLGQLFLNTSCLLTKLFSHMELQE